MMLLMYRLRALFWSRRAESSLWRRLCSVGSTSLVCDSIEAVSPSSSASVDVAGRSRDGGGEPKSEGGLRKAGRSPCIVFSARRSWKLSLSSISLPLATLASNSDFSSSCRRPPPMFSNSAILICVSASSSLSDSMILSFCSISLDELRESLRSREAGGAKWEPSGLGEELLRKLAGGDMN